MKTFWVLPVLALAACSSVSSRTSSAPNSPLSGSVLSRSASEATLAPTARLGDNLNTASKENRVSVYLGGRALDEDDYDPVDRQGVLGVEFAREAAGAGIGWEVGVLASAKEDDVSGIDVEGSTREIYAGLRKTFGDQVIRPVVGVGAAFINSKIDGNGNDDDDSSLAAYAHVGVGADVTSDVTLGLDLRYLFGSDLELGNVDTDADYAQLAFFVGFAF